MRDVPRDGFFRGLKDIQPGDLVELEVPGRTDQYAVTKIQVVKRENTEVLNQTATATLTLVTCFPFYLVGSAPDRYIVTASIRNSGRPEFTTFSAKFGPDRQEHNGTTSPHKSILALESQLGCGPPRAQFFVTRKPVLKLSKT